jgi:hypothetical protein
MDDCWANSLGGCCNTLSREHLVSAGLFGDIVEVGGFPWCKKAPIRVGISAVTSKILCARHNNELSPIDDTGQRAFFAFRELARLSTVRSRLKPDVWNVKRYEIDGLGLERWFLKTMINLCCNREYPIGDDSVVPGRPSDRLVRLAYGNGSFVGQAGLSIASHKGMQIPQEEVVSFCPLIHEEAGKVLGGLFTFYGFRFVLFVEPAGVPQPLQGITWADVDLGDCTLAFHPKKIDERSNGPHRSQVVEFRW